MSAPVSPSPSAPRIPEELLAACVHCGLCLEACPTFVETGREEESPRGRLYLMGGLAEGTWAPDRDVLAPLTHCLGCRSCETACPSGVRYGEVLEDAREAAPRPGVGDWLERWLVRTLPSHPGLLEGAAALYRALGLGRWLPRLARWHALPLSWRRFASLAPSLERRRRRIESKPPPSGVARVRLLRGCVARVTFGETEAATVRLLEAAGYAVLPEDRPACCGALARHAGEGETARRLGRELLEVDAGEEAIWVPTAAGCGAHLKALGELYPSGEEHRRALEVVSRVRDLSEALLQGPRTLPLVPRPEPVVFQDPCHLRHGQGITGEPRELLRRAGAELVEAEEADLCCGSAGTYNLFQGEMAWRLGRRKQSTLLSTGAPRIVTANPGCHLQLAAHLRGRGVEVTTLARFLAERLPGETPPP